MKAQEWSEIHEKLGCVGCAYANKKNLLCKPCCSFINRITTDENGKCQNRVEEGSLS